MDKMVEVEAIVTMSRTLYIEVPEEYSEEQIIDKAKTEIVLPHNVLSTINQALRGMRLNISKLDLNDWETNDVKYICK